MIDLRLHKNKILDYTKIFSLRFAPIIVYCDILLEHDYGGQMQRIHLTLDIIIEVPDNEKAKQIYVVQELLDKLYVGGEHYEDDVFSVKDITMTSFVKEK